MISILSREVGAGLESRTYLGPFVTLFLTQLFLAWLVGYVVALVDRHPTAWPIAYALAVLAADIVLANTLRAIADDERRSSKRPPLTFLAPVGSYALFVFILVGLSTLNQWPGRPYEFFLLNRMSYSFLPLPLILLGAYCVRLFLWQFRTASPYPEMPILRLLLALFIYYLALQSVGAYHLQQIPTFASDISTPACMVEVSALPAPKPEWLSTSLSILASDREYIAQRALVATSTWRRYFLATQVIIVAAFYAIYVFTASQYRQPSTELLLLFAPPVVLLVANSYLARLVDQQHCWSISVAPLQYVRQLWNAGVDGRVVALGWASSLPVLMLAMPLLSVTLHDPLKRALTPPSPSVRATLVTFWPRLVGGLTSRAVRAQLLFAALFRGNPTALIVAVPCSVVSVYVISLAKPPQPFVESVSVDPYVILVVSAIASSLAWLSLFVNGLYFFDSTLSTAFRAGLQAGVRRLDNHFVVLGHNDVSRRVVRQYLDTGSVGAASLHDHLYSSVNVLLPDGRIAKLLLGLVVVDETIVAGPWQVTLDNGVRAALVDVTQSVKNLESTRQHSRPVGADAARISVRATRWLAHSARLFERALQERIAYCIPAVGGRPHTGEALAAARTSYAAFVTALTSNSGDDLEGALLLMRESEHALGRRPAPLLLAVSSFAFAPVITGYSIRRDSSVRPVAPEFLETVDLARRLAADARRRLAANTRHRLLIAGHGKRVFYLIDNLLRELAGSECQRYSLPWLDTGSVIVVVGQDSTMDALPGHPCEGPWARIDDVFSRSGWKTRFIRYHSYLARPTPTSQRGLWVLYVRADGRDSQTIERLFELLAPTTLALCDFDPSINLRLVQAVGANLSPGTSRTNPLVFVTSDSGRRQVASFLRDGALYLTAISADSSPETRPYAHATFPRWRTDTYVDVHAESEQRIVGLVRAGQSPSRPSQPRGGAVEVHACCQNTPGNFAIVLGRLAGLRWDTTEQISLSVGGLLVWPLVTDLSICRTTDSADTFDVAATLQLSVRAPSHECVLRLVTHPIGRTQAAGDCADARSLVVKSPPCTVSDRTHSIRKCCGMMACPIEWTHKFDLAAQHGADLAPEEAGASAVELSLASRYWAAPQSAPVWSRVGVKESACDTSRVLLRCEGAERTGTYAAAVGALIGWRVREGRPEGQAVNLRYVRGYTCHDTQQSLITCYGFPDSLERGASPVVRGVELAVVNGGAWREYFDHLVQRLVLWNDKAPTPTTSFIQP